VKIRSITLRKKRNIFEGALDASERIESAREISFSAQTILRAKTSRAFTHIEN